jgi:alpha-galactosidase
MVKIAIFSVVAFAGLLSGSLLAAPDSDGANSPGGAEAFAQVLKAGGFAAPGSTSLPSSFVYGGQPSATLLLAWQREDKPPRREADRTIYETTWREPGGGLVATWRSTAFKKWPAMEFRWLFRNEGTTAAKPLTQVEALDLSTSAQPGFFELIHSVGGLDGDKMDSDRLAFAMSQTPLGTATLSAGEGRSSNKDLPFFLISSNSANPALPQTVPNVQLGGLFVGIGWSGQWQAVIDGSKPSALHVTAEMPGMNLALPPGEEIISPSILLGSYKGPWSTGSNLLRTILYDKYVPLLDDKKPLPPVSWNSWFILDNRISTQTLAAEADIAAKEGVEYFCIDAGWFDGDFPNGVGNWTVNTTKFPNGLKEIGDHVAGLGMKLGLWFEPERASGNTRLLREHPEWVHGDLVDFGNKDAREWIFNMMKGFIDQGHVRWIRWDFNDEPLSKWNGADAPGQNGLTQIRHIMGLYQLLDRVMKAYPDLLIEGCASGGRRIDLETIQCSHTFWKSDNTGDVSFLQFHETGANTFLPGQLLNTNLLPDSIPYDTDSILGGPFGLRCDWVKMSPQALDDLRGQIALAKRLRPLLRPQACPVDTASIVLRGLDPAAIYQIETAHGPAASTPMTGAQLAQGWNVALAPHTSAVYLYTKVK